MRRLSKIVDLRDFQINLYSSSFKTFSVQSGFFFRISIFRGSYARQCHNFKANIQKKGRSHFQEHVNFYFDVINCNYFIKVISATNFNFTPWLKLEILKGRCKCRYACMHTVYTRKNVYNWRVNKINQQKNCKWNINRKILKADSATRNRS